MTSSKRNVIERKVETIKTKKGKNVTLKTEIITGPMESLPEPIRRELQRKRK